MSAAEKLDDAPPQATTFYTSERLPPGYTSRRAFAAACRDGRIHGAHRGGRLWIVSVADYHRGAPLTLATPRTKKVAIDPVERARASLAARGFEPKETK